MLGLLGLLPVQLAAIAVAAAILFELIFAILLRLIKGEIAFLRAIIICIDQYIYIFIIIIKN